MIEIVFKNKDFIIVSKPVGLPSQPDLSGEKDALTLTGEKLEADGENGNLWLIHRLDRVVGGLLVFARNKKAAAELSLLVSTRQIEKRYLAVITGTAEGGVLKDYIFKDSLLNRAVVSSVKKSGFKEAELIYSVRSVKELDGDYKSLVDIELLTGRFHQIRSQFSSREMPIVGDKKYGSRDFLAKSPALFAYQLSFELRGKKYLFKKLPDLSAYPWNIFSQETF